MKGFMTVVLGLLIISMAQAVSAAYTDGNAYVRVVAADPATRTYTFRCLADPANDYQRDWFLHPDDGISGDDPDEVEFLDVPANQDITYTFKNNTFYHIGCNIVHPVYTDQLIRGDTHIDLRTDTHSWNPQIVPISGSGLTATWRCDTRSGALGHWEILDAKTHELKDLGTMQSLTYTVSHAGVYDIFCSADGNRVPLPTEFFASGTPYFPNQYGVPVTGNMCTPTNNGVEICDQRDNNCNGQIDENNVCTPPPSNSTCYSKVNDLPASCDGGSITTDDKSGCRKVVCASGANSMQILACDKTGYFEMYKQTVTGSGVNKICLGNVCIASEGYVKSPSYPICIGNSTNTTNTTNTCTPTNGGVEICDQKDNNCNGQVDENNVCAPPSPSNSTCATSLQNVPASCSATIIQDDYNRQGDSCRYVTCSQTNSQVVNSISIKACDKPTTVDPGYFEMYLQSTQGTPPTLCLGTTCMQYNGYAKSGSYPMCSTNSTNTSNTTCTPTNGGVEICDGKDNNCNGQVDENNVCAPTNTTCYSKVNDMPASCTGGTITTDDKSGCRKIICTNGTSSTQILACDKSGYFEMYKQTVVGSGISKICIANTCIANEGYVKSGNYPICV